MYCSQIHETTLTWPLALSIPISWNTCYLMPQYTFITAYICILYFIFLEFLSLFLLLFLNVAQNGTEMICLESNLPFISLPIQFFCPIYCDIIYIYYNIYIFWIIINIHDIFFKISISNFVLDVLNFLSDKFKIWAIFASDSTDFLLLSMGPIILRFNASWFFLFYILHFVQKNSQAESQYNFQKRLFPFCCLGARAESRHCRIFSEARLTFTTGFIHKLWLRIYIFL